MSKVRIASLAIDDVDRLCALAAQIWHRHYENIISAAQIEYMLKQRYTRPVISAELQRGDLWWDQLLVAGQMTGFSSYFLSGNTGEMKLDKLYVRYDYQRKGYGRMLLDRAISIARAYGRETLVLAVNKHNHGAIAAYKKYGFRVTESVVKDIGGGFVMDDYMMAQDI